MKHRSWWPCRPLRNTEVCRDSHLCWRYAYLALLRLRAGAAMSEIGMKGCTEPKGFTIVVVDTHCAQLCTLRYSANKMALCRDMFPKSC